MRDQSRLQDIPVKKQEYIQALSLSKLELKIKPILCMSPKKKRDQNRDDESIMVSISD
jgi:hypothetical protein